MESGKLLQPALLLLMLLIYTSLVSAAKPSGGDSVKCSNPQSPCFNTPISCPAECPFVKPAGTGPKACFVNCNANTCEAVCKNKKPNCDGDGASCFDPRFIGGDGVAFYFHGHHGGHFALISDPSLQVNARFIGHRPAGRTRDFTWIQALGIMSGEHRLTVEATRSTSWDETEDHFRFYFDGQPVVIPENHRSSWRSADGRVSLERTGARNSAVVVVDDVLEMSVGVVPVTKEDDRIHHYNIPVGDSYAHLEIQFKSLGLSPEVHGVIGRTYQPGFVNTAAKPGVEMPIVAEEHKYKTSSLFATDCHVCSFKSAAGGTVESLTSDI